MIAFDRYNGHPSYEVNPPTFVVIGALFSGPELLQARCDIGVYMCTCMYYG
jgi:hypothetical protein